LDERCGNMNLKWKENIFVEGPDLKVVRRWYLIESSTDRESYLEVRCELFFGELS